MELKDVKKHNVEKEYAITSIRIPISYMRWIKENQIGIGKLICASIDELKAKEKNNK